MCKLQLCSIVKGGNKKMFNKHVFKMLNKTEIILNFDELIFLLTDSVIVIWLSFSEYAIIFFIFVRCHICKHVRANVTCSIYHTAWNADAVY